MEFEWDDDKAEVIQRKHGVSFVEAQTVFADPLALTGYDPDHSGDEDRYIRWAPRWMAGCSSFRTRTGRIESGSSAPARPAAANGGTTKMATSPDQPKPTEDEMRPEYDFRTMRGVVRGKYAARYKERLRVVRLAEDVAKAFADEAAVNEALREYLRNQPPREVPA